jgi:hypothetical protein
VLGPEKSGDISSWSSAAKRLKSKTFSLCRLAETGALGTVVTPDGTKPQRFGWITPDMLHSICI